MTDEQVLGEPPKMWRLDLVCCGRADGHIARRTWRECDEFRGDYLNAEGHQRSAVLAEDVVHDEPCNGYSTTCPSPGANALLAASRP